MPTLDLETLVLQVGKHDTPDDGMCVMEAVAYAAARPLVDERFAPTVKALQESALQLLDRLIDVGKTETVAA